MCKCYYVASSLIIFKCEGKIKMLKHKDRGRASLFVIFLSLESLLPHQRKKDSAQSTLFFMSNAKQMRLTCADSTAEFVQL